MSVAIKRRSAQGGVTYAHPIYTRMPYPGSSREREIVSEVLGANYRGRCEFFEDFLTDDWTQSGRNLYLYDDSASGTPVSSLIANEANGVYRIGLSSTNESSNLVLNFGDQLICPADKKFFFEGRFRFPTAITTAQQVAIGMASAVPGAGTLDNYTRNAWLRLEASMAVVAEADDGTTDTDDTSTGITLSANTWTNFVIDGWDLGTIRFFIDGSKVATINASAMSGNLQPTVHLKKASGTGTPAIDTDYLFSAWHRL